jgi:hypothetical protein
MLSPGFLAKQDSVRALQKSNIALLHSSCTFRKAPPKLLNYKVVARDGIKPPTPAFSGPRSTYSSVALFVLPECRCPNSSISRRETYSDRHIFSLRFQIFFVLCFQLHYGVGYCDVGLSRFMRHRIPDYVSTYSTDQLDIQVLHIQCILFDELPAALHILAHQSRKNLFTGRNVFELHLQQRASFWIHRRLP